MFISKCEQCGRPDAPTVVHLTSMKDGVKSERHLCEKCAKGNGDAQGPYRVLMVNYPTWQVRGPGVRPDGTAAPDWHILGTSDQETAEFIAKELNELEARRTSAWEGSVKG